MNVNTHAKEILRWGVIAATGGYGVWQLIEAGRGVIRWNGDWIDLAFILLFPLVDGAIFLAVAYICLRRQYRKLFLVLGIIGTVVVFGELSALPDQLGMFQFMDRHIQADHNFAFLGLPLALLLFFGPIYAAAWFFRLCHRLAYPLPAWAERPRTQATRSLVWLGVLFLVVPPMIAMLVVLIHMRQSPNPPIVSESICDSFHWIIGLSVIGSLLMFLGLVRRQPIVKSGEETLPHKTA